MDVTPQQHAWQIRMTTRTMRIKAQSAYLDAQRQQTRTREQRERLRLQRAMPDANAWVLDLTAWLLVARDLDVEGDGGLNTNDSSEGNQP